MAHPRRRGLFAAALSVLLLSPAAPAIAGGLATESVSAAHTSMTDAGVPGDVAIVPSAKGVNVLDIARNSITLTSGDTFIYSVDTPEGKGAQPSR